MKEYIAKTGGRYTYNDDLLNLQELALSMAAIFDGCPNFIISGCVVTGGRITPGYVWINGKVRYFEGSGDPSFPFYIYEKNHYETVSYAGDVNKHGRSYFLCIGGGTVPATPDQVTEMLPGYIELTPDYAPRFIDKFVGRYALLLDSPFARQTVKRDVLFTGSLTSAKDVESKSYLSVANNDNGYSLRSTVNAVGSGSMGLYHNGTLLHHLEIGTDGTLNFYKQGIRLASIDPAALTTGNISSDGATIGSLCIEGNHIYNSANATEEGSILINRCGYKGGNTKFRNFIVYDGRTVNPLFAVLGQYAQVSVNGAFEVTKDGYAVTLLNPAYSQTDKQLTCALGWKDKNGNRIGYLGFTNTATLDFSLCNEIGNIVVHSKDWVDVIGELRVGGVSIADTYLTVQDHNSDISKKVDKIAGKQLSTEDFSTAYRDKLNSISTGSIAMEGDGFVTATDAANGLRKKLSIASNLADLADAAKARTNLDIYSRGEVTQYFLKITNHLSEITALTASEVENKTPEDIIAMKEQRQKSVRDNIDAEKKGTGDLKLAKASNLSDVADKGKARQNISVYSTAEIDQMMSGKLSSDQNYTGVVFTPEMKSKLEAIKTGVFSGTIVDGVSQSQVEGYVTTTAVAKQLALNAPKLLDGYSAADKTAVAANIGVYAIADADAKFAATSQGFKDCINYLVKQGNTSDNSKKILRDNIGAAASTDLSGYMRKDGKLLDLILSDETSQKQACSKIGAAYASEYQTKIADTGWLACGGENAGTLWARQIGSVVCVQGTINTARRSSNTWGSIATIPNQISPPKFGCRQTMADFNDDHKYNRGCSFVIRAGSRTILMHERGTYNVTTELHFSYMT